MTACDYPQSCVLTKSNVVAVGVADIWRPNRRGIVCECATDGFVSRCQRFLVTPITHCLLRILAPCCELLLWCHVVRVFAELHHLVKGIRKLLLNETDVPFMLMSISSGFPTLAFHVAKMVATDFGADSLRLLSLNHLFKDVRYRFRGVDS